MFVKFAGTPITGYASLTNGAPGPVSIVLQQISGGANYTLQPGEVVVITSIAISSNDATGQLVTIDDGITGGAFTLRRLASQYTSGTLPTSFPNFPPGTCVGRRGVNLRATASLVSAAKTVEIVVVGYVTTTT